MDIASFSVNRKILVNMIFIILVVLGVAQYMGLPRDFFPNANLNEALAVVPYRGASALEVEQQIVNKIEEAIAELEGIDEVQGRSEEGIALVLVFIEEGTEIDKFMLDLQAAVNNIPDLPEDADDPQYLELDASAIQPVCFVAVGGEANESVLLEVAEDIKKEFIEIAGVKSVDIDGLREEEIHVEADPALLDHHGASLMEIIQTLATRNRDLPGGTSELGKSEYSLRVLGKYADLDEIRGTVLRSAGGISTLRLDQVAQVSRGVEDRRSSNRLNGLPAGNLTIYKKREGNTIKIMDEVHAIVDRYNRTLPVPVRFEVRNDTAELIEERLGIMTNNAWITAILVGIFLFVFLGWTNALLVLIGIPFTFLTAFLFMSVAGMSINMLTLFALIMALGMIVDDAIVVVDNIQRYLELGFPPRTAAIQGTREVMAPVTAAVLTTVAGFTPLLFMSGMIGKFMSDIPKTVSFALLASLLEAVLILPSHSFELNRFYGRLRRKFGLKTKIAADDAEAGLSAALSGEMERKRIASALASGEIPRAEVSADKDLKGGYKVKRKNRIQRFLERSYRKQLLFTLRYRYFSILSIVVLAALSIFLLRFIPVVMFGHEDFDQVNLRYDLPPGTPLDETEAMGLRLEKLVREHLPPEELKGIVSSAGYQIVNYEYLRGSQLGELNLDLVSAADRERTDTEIMAALRKEVARVPGIVEFQLSRPDAGPPTGKPVEIHILGPRFEVLEALSQRVMAELARIPGVIEISDDYDRTVQEFKVEIDESRARAVGVSNLEVATTVSAAFQGLEATQFTDADGEDLPVMVRLAEPYRDDLETLARLKVPTRQSALAPLAGLARFTTDKGFSVIRHFDRERAITVTADVEEGQTSKVVNEILLAKFGNFSLEHPGYRLDFGGEYEKTQESFGSLIVLAFVALLAIYMILATQFNSVIQPFAVLFTVPFSFIGVVIGLLVMGYAFTIPAMVGIIALMGLVVNNSLVMVDFLNKSRLRGVGRWFSLVRTGVVRMRPILLTTVTTIVGLSTLTYASTGASKIMVPMAVSMIWGLAFATVLTLFLIPALMAIIDDIGLRSGTGKSWQLYGGGRK